MLCKKTRLSITAFFAFLIIIAVSVLVRQWWTEMHDAYRSPNYSQWREFADPSAGVRFKYPPGWTRHQLSGTAKVDSYMEFEFWDSPIKPYPEQTDHFYYFSYGQDYNITEYLHDLTQERTLNLEGGFAGGYQTANGYDTHQELINGQLVWTSSTAEGSEDVSEYIFSRQSRKVFTLDFPETNDSRALIYAVINTLQP